MLLRWCLGNLRTWCIMIQTIDMKSKALLWHAYSLRYLVPVQKSCKGLRTAPTVELTTDPFFIRRLSWRNTTCRTPPRLPILDNFGTIPYTTREKNLYPGGIGLLWHSDTTLVTRNHRYPGLLWRSDTTLGTPVSWIILAFRYNTRNPP